MKSNLVKAILRSNWLSNLGCLVIAGYLRLAYGSTLSLVRQGDQYLQNLANGDKPFLIAMWHEGLAVSLPSWIFARRKLSIFASNHFDGQLIATTMRFLGLGVISFDKHRPREGLVAAKNWLTNPAHAGQGLVIVPDGPKGPPYQVKQGIINLAQKCQVPLITVAVVTTRHQKLNSWDKLVIPLPFGKMGCVWGEVMPPPPNGATQAELEKARLELERQLNLHKSQALALALGQPQPPLS